MRLAEIKTAASRNNGALTGKCLPALAAFLILLLAAGCLPSPAPIPVEPAPGAVFDNAGSQTTREALFRAVAKSQVVLVGEAHDNPAHHRLQADVAQAMARDGKPLFLGVEWLDHTAQPLCDRLSDGLLTPEEFARQTKWEKRWGYPFAMFRPLFALAQKPNVRLVALNAPSAVVRKLAHKGLAGLSPAERSQLAPAMDLHDPVYENRLNKAFRAHGMAGGPAAARFFAAQVARDETMAHRLALRLRPWPDTGARALVLAGGGHLTAGMGLPKRIRRLLPGVRLLTVMPISKGSRAMLALRHPGAPLADFLVVTRPVARRPMLGVLVAPKPDGLLIKRVFPNSPAARAGLARGDILTMVDGLALREPKDIHKAIKAAPYKPHRYTVRRASKVLTLIIALPSPRRGPGPAQKHRE